MKAATEEFLYFLLWTAESLARPSWRSLDDSFEAWAYRSGLGRRLAELERLKLLERQPTATDGERIYRLTDSGRRLALAGVDPPERWARPWDGRWRLVIFDVPETKNRERVRLRRTLRRFGFGYLQNSVWLSPDSLDTLRLLLAGTSADVEALTFFEGRPCGGESDQDLVHGAWDFAAINKCFQAWTLVANAAPTPRTGQAMDLANLRSWARRERSAWQTIVACDPFLPAPLLPRDYLGRRAWERRVHLLNSMGKALAR